MHSHSRRVLQMQLQRLASLRAASSSTNVDVVHTFKAGEYAGRTLEVHSDTERGTLAYSLGFAKDFQFYEKSGLLNSSMKNQLASSVNQLMDDFAEEEARLSSLSRDASDFAINHESADVVDLLPMPRTFEEAMEPSSRAIVVTETTRPFPIVHVNEAWEGLCGYSRDESVGKSLGMLLRGPDTDRLATTGLMSHLLRGEEAGAVLTNYRKGGDSFRNRLRVAPLWDHEKITHFVGVLSEVHDQEYASS